MQLDQNPFVRLKRFTIAGNDPKENHATEVLAACLDLSLEFRAIFLKLTGEAVSSVGDAGAWTIKTQVPIPGKSDAAKRSIVDLLLENSAAKRVVIVEVKVGDRARPQQLREYKEILDNEKPLHGRLIALVRNRAHVEVKTALPSTTSYLDKIITWANVEDEARNLLNPSNASNETADRRIAVRLIYYLESEGISMNHKTDDLFGYAKGILAEEALTALFDYCRSEAMPISKANSDFITKSDRAKAFPRLIYSFRSGYFDVDVHFRAKGLENWSGGHALALGITGHSKLPKADAARLAREFHADGWQVWHPTHAQGAIPQPWKAAKEPSDIPPEIHGFYLYRPLFGDRNQPSDHAPILEPPITDWDALLSLVADRFITAIRKLKDFESSLPGKTAATIPMLDSAGGSS